MLQKFSSSYTRSNIFICIIDTVWLHQEVGYERGFAFKQTKCYGQDQRVFGCFIDYQKALDHVKHNIPLP